MTMMKSLFGLSLVIAVLGLSGCSSLVKLGPDGPAPAIYTLEPLSRQGAPKTDAPVLFVEEPQVSGALDSLRIAVKRSPVRYEYLPNARWEERTTRLIQRHVARSLDNRTGLNAVGDVNIDLPLLYRLRLDVRKFEATADDAGNLLSVDIAWVATLMDAMSSRVLATQPFKATDRPQSTIVPDAIAHAYNRAMNQIVGDMADWAEKTILKTQTACAETTGCPSMP